MCRLCQLVQVVASSLQHPDLPSVLLRPCRHDFAVQRQFAQEVRQFLAGIGYPFMIVFHSASVSRVDMIFVRALSFTVLGRPPLFNPVCCSIIFVFCDFVTIKNEIETIEIEVQNACFSLRELRFIAPLQQQSANSFCGQNGFCGHKSTTCLTNLAF